MVLHVRCLTAGVAPESVFSAAGGTGGLDFFTFCFAVGQRCAGISDGARA